MAEIANSSIICSRLHQIFHNLRRYSFPFDEDNLPENGIYVLFEKGEHAHNGLDRIVRVGTHTGWNNLGKRLAEHFLTENKDRSIFRKNIGRALLNRQKDPFLKQWEMDLTAKESREQHAARIDSSRLSEIEIEVSRIIRTAFTFCVFRVDRRPQRLELEARMIATINHCTGCHPSKHWLGSHSPRSQIRESGLWLVQHLNGPVMTIGDLENLEKRIHLASNSIALLAFPATGLVL